VLKMMSTLLSILKNMNQKLGDTNLGLKKLLVNFQNVARDLHLKDLDEHGYQSYWAESARWRVILVKKHLRRN